MSALVGSIGDNIGGFGGSNPGLGKLLGFVVAGRSGSWVPIGGKIMSGSVNGGGELLRGGPASCSGGGTVEGDAVGGGFGSMPEWMVDR